MVHGTGIEPVLQT